jgi:hypothetical protein
MPQYVIANIHNDPTARVILLQIKIILFVVYLTMLGRLLNSEIKEAVVA